MSVIAAISSPIGVGGIGIVRMSGDGALKIADAIFLFNGKKEGEGQHWQPLMLNFGTFLANGFKDKGYAVYFPAAKAYTGEETVEFYLHGGARIMQGALETLISRGAVQAGAGEFTKRAFLSGRLSLADAEGVMDMIGAESASGLRAAYRLMQGEVSRKTDAICDELGQLITGLEATLDYPDEMEDEVLPPLGDGIRSCLNEVNALLSTAAQGRLAKYGITAVLTGRANAGKSSLFNAMLGERRAIVSDIRGTTRDTIEAAIEHAGVKINLVDTAGIREDAEGSIESEGISRARRAAKSADVILHVIDKAAPEDDEDYGDALVFDVYNKSDVNGFEVPRKMYTYAVSALTGEGVSELLDGIASIFREGGGDGEIITNERHVSALYQAKYALESALLSLNGTIDLTLIDLRRAYDALGEITGKTAGEDVVNAIFSRFCVGK